MHLQENTLHDLELEVKVTQNIPRSMSHKMYPVPSLSLYHVTYALAKFEAATPNSLGGFAFTRKYII